MEVRYSFGGDEHLLVEIDESMSLEAFFMVLSLARAVRESKIKGVTEICPANASLLIRFDPDLIHPNDLLLEVKSLEERSEVADQSIKTRIIEVPVLYSDPWTHETLMRFRDRHQDPTVTDPVYSARVNGFESVEALVEAHSTTPWFVSMVGFVAALPWFYQIAERSKQIQTPKYLRPRTDTPKQAVVHGGCFSAVHPVRSPGGYQMLGITPLPIYDPERKYKFLSDTIFFRPGDIIKFTPVTREVYDHMVDEVEQNRFQVLERPASFSLAEFQRDHAGSTGKLKELLNAD